MFEQTSSEAPPDVRDARRRSTAVRFHTTLRARVHLSYYSLSLSNSTWTLAWVLCSGVHVLTAMVLKNTAELPRM